MGGEPAALRRTPTVAQRAVDAALEAGELGVAGDSDPQHPGLAARREMAKSLEAQAPAAAFDQGQRLGDLVDPALVDLADEAQRQMLLVRRQPADVAQPAGQRLERAQDRIGQSEGDEQAGHGRRSGFHRGL